MIAEVVQPCKSVSYVCQEARAGYQGDGGVHREKTERKKLEVVRQEANLGEAALRLGVSGHSVSLSTSKTFDMVKMEPMPCIFNSSEYFSLGA